MFEVYKKFESAVDEALSDELTLEKLRAIEQETLELARMTEVIPNPGLEHLGRYASVVSAAVRSAQGTEREIFVCELPKVDGREPRMRDLEQDPELARVVTYLYNLGLDPRIRTCGMLNGVAMMAGNIFDPVWASERARKVSCLLIMQKDYLSGGKEG